MAQQTMPYLKLIALDKLREGEWSRDDLNAAGGFKITDPLTPASTMGGLLLSANHKFTITNHEGTPSIAIKRTESTGVGAALWFTPTSTVLPSFPSARGLFLGIRVTADRRLVDAIVGHAYTGKRSITYRATLEAGVSYYIELGVTITESDPSPTFRINDKVLSGTEAPSSTTPQYKIGLDILNTGSPPSAPVNSTVYYADPYIHVSHESRPTGFLGDIDIRTSDMTLVDGGGWSTSSGESELKPIDVINGVKTDATTPSIALSKTGSTSSIKCDITRIGENPDLMGACLNITTFRDPSSGYSTHVQMGCTYQNITQRFVETVRLTPADKFSPVVSQNISMSIVNRGYILGSTAPVSPKIIDVSIKSIKV